MMTEYVCRYLAVRWECVFLPDNGAIFLNDMLMNATIFNAWILLRGTHLLSHLAALATSRSWAEARVGKYIPNDNGWVSSRLLIISQVKAKTREVRRQKLWVGENMCWLLLNYSIMTSLSLSCPLITPVGLIYLIGHHSVDSFNLMSNVYHVAKVDTKSFYRKVSRTIYSMASRDSYRNGSLFRL